jgi:hypothetical protein
VTGTRIIAFDVTVATLIFSDALARIVNWKAKHRPRLGPFQSEKITADDRRPYRTGYIDVRNAAYSERLFLGFLLVDGAVFLSTLSAPIGAGCEYRTSRPSRLDALEGRTMAIVDRTSALAKVTV